MHPALFATNARDTPEASPAAREIRKVAKDLARTLHDAAPKDVVGLARRLIEQGNRPLAYELVYSHRPALESLKAKDVLALGKGLATFSAVDHFACFVAGQAWRRGLIGDEVILKWAHSKDRFWRRAAVVATVPLNRTSQGGVGDASRTLRICKEVLTDRDDLVVRALSWALRELSKRDRRAVERFLARHAATLASLVRREVTNKLETGSKSGRTVSKDTDQRAFVSSGRAMKRARQTRAFESG